MSTFGKTAVGGSSDQDGGGVIRGCKFTLTEGGKVSQISLNCRTNAAGTTKITMGIYRDNGSNAPSNKMLVSAEASYADDGTTFNWVNATVSPGVYLPPGTYWIVFTNDGGTGGLWYKKDALTSGVANVANAYPTFPDPFGAPGYQDFEISLYATYIKDSGYSGGII